MAEYPTEIQHLPDGRVDWPRLEVRRHGHGTMSYVPVICGVCGKERLGQAPGVRADIARGKTTGRCRSCAPLLKRDRVVAKYRARGTEELPNGAKIDWATTEAPAPGISGRHYLVEIICRCGDRRVRGSSLLATGNSGLCKSCASSDSTAGPKNPRWKDGRSTVNGYRMVRIPPGDPMISMAECKSIGGWGHILEHRLIAARSIDRPLESWEHVHHLNGDKLDNRPENLQIVTQAEHNTITKMEQEIRRLQKKVSQLERENESLRSARDLLPSKRQSTIC